MAPVGSSVRRVILIAVAVGILFPAIRMVPLVRSGTPANFADYWNMVPTVFRADGWPSISGLFVLRNQHPMVVPKLMYWMNNQINGGSNISLGLWIIAIGLIQIAVVALMVRRVHDVSPWVKGGLVIVASALVFGRLGSWSFMRSMSGAAWLTANLFVLGALYFQASRRRSLVLVCGVLASLSYGTGLLVWPALLVAGLVRDKRFRSQWRTVAAGALMAATYLIMRHHTGGVPSTASPSIRNLIHNAAVTLGSAIGGERTGLDVVVAGSMLFLGLASMGVLIRKGNEEMAPWAGLFAWGVGSALLISDGRSEYVGNFAQGRYYSIGALTVIAVLALIIIAMRPYRMALPAIGAVLVAICGLSLASGSAAVNTTLDQNLSQETLAIALRVGIAHRSTQWTILEPMPPIETVLKKTDHYPFNRDFTLGCGRIGTKLGTGEIAEPLPHGVSAVQTGRHSEFIPFGELFNGQVSKKPDCVLVTDANRQVIGAGSTVRLVDSKARAANPDAQSLSAIAPVGVGSYRVFARFPGSPTFYRVRSLYTVPGS